MSTSPSPLALRSFCPPFTVYSNPRHISSQFVRLFICHTVVLKAYLTLIDTAYSFVDLHFQGRLTLAWTNVLALCLFRRAVFRRFGAQTSTLFALIALTQFHVPFWMGRTIPNMFAFPLGMFHLNLSIDSLFDGCTTSDTRVCPTAR